jgi:hypothetical protein
MDPGRVITSARWPSRASTPSPVIVDPGEQILLLPVLVVADLFAALKTPGRTRAMRLDADNNADHTNSLEDM